MPSVISPVPAMVMTLVSSWSPQLTCQPAGRVGCGAGGELGRRGEWVHAGARRGAAVGAGGEVAGGVARFGPAVTSRPPAAGVSFDHAGVDLAERGGGEGGKHRRMCGDVFGDAFAADQPGAHDLVGVALVALRAAGAD